MSADLAVTWRLTLRCGCVYRQQMTNAVPALHRPLICPEHQNMVMIMKAERIDAEVTPDE